MEERITTNELEKAAKNLERLAAFLGERRTWDLASGGESAATATREAAKFLADTVAGMVEADDAEGVETHQPEALQPPGSVSANRLQKFADFLNDLGDWFAVHSDAELPEDADSYVLAMRQSLASACEAIDQLFRPPPSSPLDDSPLPQEPLTSSDLGPVAAVDAKASLILENNFSRPLLETFKGVKELSAHTRGLIDEFLAAQSIQFDGAESRRLYDKVLRWIEATPEGRVLVIKISGLSGKPQAYSSYQPKRTQPAKEKAD
jgi:hypothetical protein